MSEPFDLGWIPVGKEMPPEFRVVIVYIPRDSNWTMHTTHFQDGAWHGIGSYQFQPSHWMHMPKPPADPARGAIR